MKILLFAVAIVAAVSHVARAEDVSSDAAPKTTTLAAQVYGTGDGADLVAKMGAKGVKRVSKGVFQISFKRRVDTCFPSATLFYPGNSISAQPQFKALKDTMIVAIKNATGEFVDDRFWLVVNCPD